MLSGSIIINVTDFIARVTDCEAWAVATDLSKAHDRILLRMLEDALRDTGLPAGAAVFT